MDSRSYSMTTALHEAACNDQLEVARLIVLSGGHVDPLDKDEETPLMMAAQFKAFSTFLRKLTVTLQDVSH